MWVIELFVDLPSFHLGAPTRRSTPEMLRIRERVPIHSPSIVSTFGFVVESIKELKGASHEDYFYSIIITPIITYWFIKHFLHLTYVLVTF
jgi:hypothetical protein